MIKAKIRNHDIHVKLTKGELDTLRTTAEKEHLPTSSLIRQLIFKGLKVRG